jgi:hypothetical protein
MRKLAVLPQEENGGVGGVRISETAMRPFVFADIQTTGTGFPSSPDHSVLFTRGSRIIQTKTQYLATTMPSRMR